MLTTTIQPRLSETDALGHINNTAFPVWFAESRISIFKIFDPSLDVKRWPLILARTEIDFLAQTYWGSEVTIKVYVSKLGDSSCNITHEAWQNNTMVAKGLAIMIYFDYQSNKSITIPQEIREQLTVHMQSS